MSLELVAYPTLPTLQAALREREIHTTCVVSTQVENSPQSLPAGERGLYSLQTRVQRLYEIMQTELPPDLISVSPLQADDLSRPDVDPLHQESSESAEA